MATKPLITKVWIEPGCIVCDACETSSPEVFEVLDDTCIIRPAALTAEFTKPRTESIIEAAEECPVDVIKYETVEVEAGAEAPAAESTAAAEAPAPTAAAAPAAEKPSAAHAAADKATAKPAAGEPGEPVERAPARKQEPVPVGSAGGGDAGDPGLAALLKAATSRGGSAGLLRTMGQRGEQLEALRRKDPSALPPDARQARVLEAARKLRKDPDLQRRAFVKGTALAIGWTAFGVGAGTMIGPAFGRFMMPNVLEEPDPRIRVGKLQRYAEMQPGEVNEDYKPQGIWIVREELRIAALSIICTHLGCIPNWLPNDRKFKCPCHGSGYYYNGINFEGPTPRPLERFRMYIEEGIVIVDKSKKYQHELGQWDMPGSYLEV
jgi:cytochrome b6-f complex iron-sulfur subunit